VTAEARPYVLVTGASRGIGRATALAFAARGADLLLVTRSAASAEETRAVCAARGARIDLECADFTERAAVADLAGRLAHLERCPSVVVHCAGSVRRAPVHEQTVSDYDEQLDVNLRTPFVLNRSLLPALRAQGFGRLLHVGSISGTLGTAGQVPYNASKWGLIGLVKSLAEELTNSGLMAAVILPGAVDTDMLRGSVFPPRMTAEDVAKTLVYLGLDAPLAHNGAVVDMFGV
jgi:3-oxoacyl-[acyl-carrier protein] reductase